MHHYNELTWPALNALDRKKTVIFIPFSPIEEHGPHLPMGTDLYIAVHMAERIAQRIESEHDNIVTVLFPPVPLGAGTVPMLGSVNVSGDLVFEVARQLGSAFARDGFHHIVFINGHMGGWHMLALENAARAISRRYHVNAIAPTASLARELIWRGQLATSLQGKMTELQMKEFVSGLHSGMLETSVMLATHNGLVHQAYATLPRISGSAMLRWRGRKPTKWQGYVGNPAEAAAEWGEIALEQFAIAGTQLILRLVAEDKQAPLAARIFPRVPYSLAIRKWRALGIAAATGALLAWTITQLLQQKRT